MEALSGPQTAAADCCFFQLWPWKETDNGTAAPWREEGESKS